jgi:hypothetical protein
VTVSEPAFSAPAYEGSAQVTPTPTDEETVAIVAAMEALWPKPVAVTTAPVSRDRSWKFSGRWWARPVAVRRDRPWH